MVEDTIKKMTPDEISDFKSKCLDIERSINTITVSIHDTDLEASCKEYLREAWLNMFNISKINL